MREDPWAERKREAAERVRVALVQGIRPDSALSPPFVAYVELQPRDNGVYYTWRAEAEDGTFLAAVSRLVSDRVVPAGTDPLEHALSHASENINCFRDGREHLFHVTSVAWT